MSPDPWEGIGRPLEGLTVRRVDPAHPAEFFWGRDAAGRCSLVLVVRSDVNVADERPTLNGIEILEAPYHDGRAAFVLTLRREEDRELFRRLCDDIVDTCRTGDGDRSFLSSTIRRAWKWHSLLRGASRPRLGREEQQGLIGELLFLERLAKEKTPKSSIDAWRGPLGEPKDFAFEGRAVEIKARHAGKNSVKISSEHQLQRAEDQVLSLVVYSLGSASEGTFGAFTLDELVLRVRQGLVEIDPSADEGFDARLLGAGYSPDHGYGDIWWMVQSVAAFAVTDGFPRIEAAGLPRGVSTVTYWLQLDHCSEFERPVDELFLLEASK